VAKASAAVRRRTAAGSDGGGCSSAVQAVVCWPSVAEVAEDCITSQRPVVAEALLTP
jgi:hypothetical protein